MADYIERNAAIEAMRIFADGCPGSTEAATAAAMAISEISRLPNLWISVEDRLPETSGRYLCVHHFVIDGAPRLTDKPISIIYYDSAENRFQNENLYGMKVSHWMPLPDMPGAK